MTTSALFKLLVVSILTVSGWEQYLNPKDLALPDSASLSVWRWNNNYAQNDGAAMPESMEKVAINCDSDRLWPTHPEQITKDYIYAVSASYKNKEHSDANAIVMSDFYQDECGNMYKGYWVASFLSDEETMHTLLSKGRRIIRKPGGYPGEYTSGSTFAVNENEFLFFTELSAEENGKVELSQERALDNGYRLDHQQWVRD